MRWMPEIRHHLGPLEEALRSRFIPAITDGHIQQYWTKHFVFPHCFGGLVIPVFYEQAGEEYSNSKKLTAQLTPLIKNQNKQ